MTDSPIINNPLRSDRDKRMPTISGPAVFVLFGVTGDLARKKILPALYDLANRGLLPSNFAIVGYGRREWDDKTFIDFVESNIRDHTRTSFHESTWERLKEGLRYVKGTFDESFGYESLKKTLNTLDETRNTQGNYVFYLSIPPGAFPVVCKNLGDLELNKPPAGSWRRVIIEKPFGHDKESAIELNTLVNSIFPERDVFRIDHYLGKETVQNILSLRFANTIFEPIWNKNFVDNVQITMAEDIGVGGRASYYDGIGAARDVIQNHLLQLLALIAIEPPVDSSANAIKNEKIKVLENAVLQEPYDETAVNGQYTAGWQGAEKVVGLLEEPGFSKDSKTETYAAVTALVDTERWEGVPFYLRTGKRLGKRVTEIALEFNNSPNSLFPSSQLEAAGLNKNSLVIRVQPDEGITLRFKSKIPGSTMEIRDVNMDFSYGTSFTQSSPEAYERLILDVLLNQSALFPVAKEVELSWNILDPVLNYWKNFSSPETYPAGTWGPHAADKILARTGRQWRRL